MADRMGIIRRFDELGRICIPKEIRERLFGKRDVSGLTMELFIENDSIILKEWKNIDKEQKIRNKAIDEFFDELQEYKCEDNWLRLKMSSIYEIAEELKGGESK